MNMIKAENWIGKIVAEYKILMEVGRGQAGVVFLAEHTVEKHCAAVKIFSAGNVADAALKSARIVKRLSHAGIAAILDCGNIEDDVYVVTEYVSFKKNICDDIDDCSVASYSPASGELFSKNLTEYVETQSGLVSEKNVVDILCQIINVLQYLFGINNSPESSLFYGGINPNRVLVTEGEEGKIKIKLTDIGVPVIRGRSTDIDVFLSPEELQGQIANERSHVYSLGAIAYNLITGVAPPSPVMPPAEVRGDICAGWNEIIKKSLTFEPEKRYSDCQSFRSDLLHVKSLIPKKVTFNALKGAIVSFAILIALILIYTLGANLMKEDILEMDSISKKVKSFAGKFYTPDSKELDFHDTESTGDVEEILDMTESVAVTDIFEKSAVEKIDESLPGGVPEVKVVDTSENIPVKNVPEKIKVEYMAYTVKKNDSLWGISWKHYMKIKELLFINDLSEGVIIKPGQKLKVKKGKTREMPKRKAKPVVKTNETMKVEDKTDETAKMHETTNHPALRAPLLKQEGSTEVTNKIEIIEYTVVKGDTYYNLSKKFNCTVKELEEVNDNKKLITGMKIKVEKKN
ncbi:LysM peptidoglycan-binding domain-containing protein [bacterium]|nr:LysM peptidoglycan-binding domain-containing protein [bacterium]